MLGSWAPSFGSFTQRLRAQRGDLGDSSPTSTARAGGHVLCDCHPHLIAGLPSLWINAVESVVLREAQSAIFHCRCSGLCPCPERNLAPGGWRTRIGPGRAWHVVGGLRAAPLPLQLLGRGSQSSVWGFALCP